MINKLAYLTAKYINDYIQNMSDSEQREKEKQKWNMKYAKRKKKPYRELTEVELISMMEYSLKSLYSDAIKIIILLIFSSFLHIILPTLVITCIFAVMRPVAGGVHMGTFFNCLGITTILFLIGGVLVQNIININFINQNMLYLIMLESILSLYLVIKYAPRDTPNRPIKEQKEINKFKILSIVFVSIINIILIILIITQQYLIVLAGIYGLLLEVLTIIPLGVKIFNYIDCKINKLFNMKKVNE